MKFSVLGYFLDRLRKEAGELHERHLTKIFERYLESFLYFMSSDAHDAHHGLSLSRNSWTLASGTLAFWTCVLDSCLWTVQASAQGFSARGTGIGKKDAKRAACAGVLKMLEEMRRGQA